MNYPPTTITHISDSRFSIRIRRHEILVDQTVAGGGSDSGPTPLDLLGASLGGCIAYYIHQFFHARGINAHPIRVEVSPSHASNPHRIQSFKVNVHLPHALSDHHLPLLERVIEVCPAYNTLIGGAEVEVNLISPAAELMGV